MFTDPYVRDRTGAQGGVANYDVSPSGDRFVMVEGASESDAPSERPRINVAVNWIAELKARVPSP